MTGHAARSWLSLAASVVVSACLLAAVASQVNWQAFVATVYAVDWMWVGAGTGGMLAYQWFRGERFRHLMQLPRGSRLYTTMCLQSFFRKVLPSWLGEASQIWLLNWRHGATVPRGTALLLIARATDLAIFLGALVVTVLLTATQVQGVIAWVVILLALALAGLVGALVLLVRFELQMMRAAQHRYRAIAWAAGKLGQLIGSLRLAAGSRVLLPVAVHSLAMWSLMYGRLYCFVYALGEDLTLLEIFWVFVLLFPMNLLPIRGVAGLGTHEAAWFVGLSLVGVPAERAATLALGSHMLIFVAVGVCLLVGLVGMGLEAASARASRRTAI